MNEETPGEDPQLCLWTDIDEIPCINPLKKMTFFNEASLQIRKEFSTSFCPNCLQFQRNSLLEEILREIKLLRITGRQ